MTDPRVCCAVNFRFCLPAAGDSARLLRLSSQLRYGAGDAVSNRIQSFLQSVPKTAAAHHFQFSQVQPDAIVFQDGHAFSPGPARFDLIDLFLGESLSSFLLADEYRRDRWRNAHCPGYPQKGSSPLKICAVFDTSA